MPGHATYPAPTRLAHQAGMAAHLGRAPRGQRMGAGEVFGYQGGDVSYSLNFASRSGMWFILERRMRL